MPLEERCGEARRSHDVSRCSRSMTGKGWLLATAAVAGAAAWTAAASAATLMVEGLWDHAYFARGHAWAWAWLTYLMNPAARASMGPSLAAGAMAASLPGVLAIRLNWSKLTGAKALHGRSWWLTRREARSKRAGFSVSTRPRPDALLLGTTGWGPFRRYIGLPGEEHVALTARTRSGKGVGFVNPNALNWGGSLVCFSVKRDVWQIAAAQREAMGDEVRVFDLSDPDRRTHRWNPLGYVRRGDPAAYGDIQRAMWFLIPETKANNPFWDNAGRKLATAVGTMLAETPGAKLNVAEVLGAVQRPDWAEHLTAMVETARRAGRPYPRQTANVVLGLAARKDEQPAKDVIETMTTALSLWNDPIVAAATECSDFDLGQLRSKRMAVFVCGGPADIRIYRPVYGLLFQQLVQVNTRVEFGRDPAHRHRVLGLLDEFWALGKQDVLADAAAFTASFGFRWAYVQQTKDQSETAFGPAGARNLFNNTGADIVFGGLDQETAEKISKRDFDTVAERSRSRPRFMGWLQPNKQSESESARRRALALPQEITRLPNTQAIVLRPGLMPLKLDRVIHYRDRWFKRLVDTPPPVPALNVRIERDASAAPASTNRQPAWSALP